MRIIEWNINHRLGYSKNEMPPWVINKIKGKADITILTECSNRVSNWQKVLCESFLDSRRYLIFSSNNDCVNNNDVTIVVNKESVEVISMYSLVAKGHNAPDHLQLKCKSMETGKLFTLVGLRIHAMNITDDQKQNQFKLVLDSISNEECVIIAGDFNCNRRCYIDKGKWNLQKIDEIIKDDYRRETPSGASWAKDVPSDNKYCFALDHFIVKGIRKFNVEPYDRSFVKYEPKIYKWGTNFQADYGWDKPENTVRDPYPDHAILSAEFFV